LFWFTSPTVQTKAPKRTGLVFGAVYPVRMGDKVTNR
jgi:hypothetical protein